MVRKRTGKEGRGSRAEGKGSSQSEGAERKRELIRR